MQEQQSEHPIKLIEVDESGKYVMSKEGATFISQLKPPIAVISVAGMYRTGKSYLLNRMLLDRSNGFGVGPTVNPCTKGLWCWGKPILGKTPDGDSVNVVIIDTEGIGALDEDQTHDTRIFTLAILAASSFIYNSTGSIDENALQNLSLVVNLTKNIQLHNSSSSQEEEEDDPEDLASYFPTFHWVVRDFSLQLINSEGDTISSKEYLERALAPQKGFSDDVEEKNRIRRLLTSFFPERDCITLVRPLTSQKQLQYLDTLEMESLRPEFVEQVRNLRRKVLGRIKPKLFKGKELDGQMYLCMLNSYLSAINNGAVPNIQNAWTYMCQQKCAQAFQESLQFFNSEVVVTLKNSFPIEDQFLLQKLNELKQKSCDLFEKKAVGENTKFHLKQLRNKLQEKIQIIKNDNEMQSEGVLKSYFKKSIVGIENKLRFSEYEKFEDFMKELNQFSSALIDNGPNLPRRDLIYLQMLRKVIPTAAEIFLKNKSTTLERVQELANQKEKSLMQCINKLKNEHQQLQESQKQKITKLDRQRIDIEMQLEENKKMMEEIKQAHQVQREELKGQLEKGKEESSKNNKDLKERISSLQEKVEELQGSLVSVGCQRDKEYAIKNMKIEQMQAQLEDLKKKNGQLEITLKTLEFEKREEMKEISLNFDEKMKNKEVELKKQKNTLKELSENYSLLESQFQMLKEENGQKIQKLQTELNEKLTALTVANKDIQSMKEEIQRTNEEQIFEFKRVITESETKMQQLEKQLKSSIERISINEQNYLTEKALLEQKVEFASTENCEYKKQIQKQKQDFETKIQQIIEEEGNKVKNSQELLDQLSSYQKQIEKLTKDKDAVQKSYENEKIENSKIQEQYKSEMEQLRNKFQKDEKKYLQTISEYEKNISEQISMKGEEMESIEVEWKKKQKMYCDKIESLEDEMEEMKDQLEREQRQERQKSEEVVLQLKNYYELEKEKLESKINVDKDKFEKKMREIRDEYEERLKSETSDLEGEYEILREKFFDIEEELNKEQTNKKIQLQIKNKNIENLEKMAEQLKSKYEMKEQESNQKIQKIQKEYSVQKEVHHAKVEELILKNNKLEREKSSLTQTKEQQEKNVQSKESYIQHLKDEMSELKKKAEQGKEEAKMIKNQMSTRLMEEKVQFTKRQALLEQENQYLKKKIEEFEKSHSNFQSQHEEKVKKIRDELSSELRETKKKGQLEFEAMEEKYEQLKKLGKEKEATQQKKMSTMEKDLAISQQKITNLNQKVKFYEEKQNTETEKYSTEINELKSSFAKEKEVLKEQLETEIKEKEKMESEKKSSIAGFQHEIALLQNKNKFLEEGKDRYKQEYEETKNKLESIIEGNRKKWINEKNAIQINHSEYITKLEKKNWDEKQELIENHKKFENDVDSRVKNFQQQIRVLNEKLAMEEQNKNGEQKEADRKVKELELNEKRLLTEIQRLKSQRNGQLHQNQNYEKDKENLKHKLKEKEQKIREIEKKKQHLFYEIEKERAKWNMEKENLLIKYEEQKDIVNKYERDFEKLNRENEKLKMEKKCHNRSSFQSSGRYSNNFSIDKGTTSRSSIEDSILKENSNNNSRVSESSLFFN